ncbi:MAG: hypothetical protein AAF927_17555 [Bacteroidota bacterium]
MKPVQIILTLCLCLGLSAQVSASGTPGNSLRINGLNLRQSGQQKLSPLKERRDLVIKVGLNNARLANRSGGTDTEFAGGFEFGFMTIRNKRLLRGFGVSYYTTQAGAGTLFTPTNGGEVSSPTFAGIKAPIFVGFSLLNRDDLKLRAYGGGMLYAQTNINADYISPQNLSFANFGVGTVLGVQFAWKLLLAEIYTERGLTDLLSNGTEAYTLSNLTYSLGLRF